MKKKALLGKKRRGKKHERTNSRAGRRKRPFYGTDGV